MGLGSSAACCLAAAVLVVVLSNPDSVRRVSAYSAQTSRTIPITTTSSGSNGSGRLSAHDILETARTLRSGDRTAATTLLRPDLYAQLFDSDPDSVRRYILDDPRTSSSASASASASVAATAVSAATATAARTASSSSWTETLFDEPEELLLLHNAPAADDDLEIESRVHDEREAVTTLSRATGSEIPDMALHLQMEAARRRARNVRQNKQENTVRRQKKTAFISGHVDDATAMEKLAMNAVPVQLPEPLLRETAAAATAATAAGKIKSKKNPTSSSTRKVATTVTGKARSKSKSKDAANAPTAVATRKAVKETSAKNPTPQERKTTTRATTTATTTTVAATAKIKELSPKTDRADRITPEEEIELARIIQRGSNLHNLKSTFETKHGRDITRQEWTELANLESPRELRRLVSIYRSAKNKLVASNMGLVYAVVRGKHGNRLRASGISEDELIQEGSLGLIRAAELFDPERGLRFSTYATIWIKGVLSNSKVDETIALPVREKTKWNKIRKASRDLLLEQSGGSASADSPSPGAKPKLRDVAARTGLSEEVVERVTSKMEQAQKLLSLDYRYQTSSRSGNDVSTTTSGFDADSNLQTDADLVERLQFRADVIAALARNLTPNEARLMRLRYGLKDGISRSLAECAEAMGCSRDKCRLLANSCLKKLREADEADGLQEYLLTVA